MKRILMFLIMILGVFLNKSTASLEKSKGVHVKKNPERIHTQDKIEEEAQKILEARLRGLGYFH